MLRFCSIAAVALVGSFSTASASAADAVLYDSAGFEAAASGDQVKLVGRDGWRAVPGKPAGIVISDNRALSGLVSARSEGRLSAASRRIEMPTAPSAFEFVLRATLGSQSGDDTGSGSVSLSAEPGGEPWVLIRRDGTANEVLAAVSGTGPTLTATSGPLAQGGAFTVELVLRVGEGLGIDAVSVRVRTPGQAAMRYLPLTSGQPEAGGFYPMEGVLPGGPFYLNVQADNPDFRRSVRIDDISVLMRAVAEPLALAPLTDKAKPAGLPVMPVTRDLYPDTSGVVDVTQPPYNARGDGVTDDTAAIQAALSRYKSGNRIIFLPDGEYLVSKTLEWPRAERSGDAKRTTLEGESMQGTVIKLKDNAPGFQDAKDHKAVIWTGDRPAQRFRNKVRNLTIDTGRGNPGASGLQFNTSNAGHVMDLIIRSGDGAGVAGLDLAYTSEIGNLYGRNIEITGFDHGILTHDRVNGVFLEDVRLTNQRRYAVFNGGQVFGLRRLQSRQGLGAQTLFNTRRGVVSLLDAEVSGGVRNTIVNDKDGILYVRDLKSDAKPAIKNLAPDPTPTRGLGTVKEYASWDLKWRQAGVTKTALRLPVKEAPFPRRESPQNWVVPDLSVVKGDDVDHTPAIQRAIDSGARTVVLPAGLKIRLGTDLVVRGSVERIIGTNAWVYGPGSIRIADGEPDLVMLEGMEMKSQEFPLRDIIVDTQRTFHLFDCMVPGIRIETAGDVFITDVSSHQWNKRGTPVLSLNHPDARVWCRNFNPEVEGQPKIDMRAGMLWAFGYKTENHGPTASISGGMAEFISVHIYSQGRRKTRAALEVSGDAVVTLAGWRQYTFKDTWFERVIDYRRAGRSAVLPRSVTLFNGIPLVTVGKR